MQKSITHTTSIVISINIFLLLKRKFSISVPRNWILTVCVYILNGFSSLFVFCSFSSRRKGKNYAYFAIQNRNAYKIAWQTEKCYVCRELRKRRKCGCCTECAFPAEFHTRVYFIKHVQTLAHTYLMFRFVSILFVYILALKDVCNVPSLCLSVRVQFHFFHFRHFYFSRAQNTQTM